MPIQHRKRTKTSPNTNQKDIRKRLELRPACEECGSKIGPFGCCNQIRKLSRQIAYAALIARKSRSEIKHVISKLNQDSHTIPKLENIYEMLRELI
jgi:hypothetical protein